MKKLITIFFPISEGAGSGGNNFLRSLKKEFIKKGVWADDIETAHVVIFNSHQNAKEVIKLRKNFPETIFIHRVDGPMTIYNGLHDKRDKTVKLLNSMIADGTVFQSEWSKDQNISLSLCDKKKSVVIHNAPNPEVFYIDEVCEKKNEKLKIISSGWSKNPNKGGADLVWLDKNLDFDRFELEFIGPTELSFSNIYCHGKKTPEELGDILKKADIFFFPSKYEACSNALLEGIHSGLIPLAKNSSSNIEVVQNEALLYNDCSELLYKLNYIGDNLNQLLSSIKLKNLSEIADEYYLFATSFERESNIRFNYQKAYIKLIMQKIFNQLGLP